MQNKNSYRHTLRMPRALPAVAAPKGAVIICAYLVGMTGIGASAYAVRDVVFSPPPVVSSLGTGMHQPLPEAALRIGAGPDGAVPLSRVTAPRLAALIPSDTRLRDDLASPISRIFLGRPAAVPPQRPARQGTPEAGAEQQTETAAVEPVATGLTGSLRPRPRPAGLTPEAPLLATTPSTDIEGALRLASLSAPNDSATAPRPEPEETLPATPPIARGSGTCPRQLARAIPRRSGSAPGAQAVLASVQQVDGVKRDDVVLREILRGNMPGFLRNLVPVRVTGRAGDGRNVEITLCVTPDYLALGSDRDYVRVPLGLRAATRIGDEFNMLLPTPRMVDLIYRAAALRLAPRPMEPGPQMTSTAYFTRHNATVEAQRVSAGAVQGTLISGHKKDVVLTTRLASNRGRVAIYGWHRTNGQPIQPLSTVHGAGYADYSHGVRLVSRTAYLDGKPVDLRNLIADPRYAGLLSKEGPVAGPGLRMAALAAN